MAEYLILIAEDENAYATASPEVLQQVMEAHGRFAEQVAREGREDRRGPGPAADQHGHHDSR